MEDIRQIVMYIKWIEAQEELIRAIRMGRLYEVNRIMNNISNIDKHMRETNNIFYLESIQKELLNFARGE